MRKQFCILLVFFASASFAQITWFPSDTDYPSDYFPVKMTQAADGDIFMICKRLQAGNLISKLVRSGNNGLNWAEVQMTGIPAEAPDFIISAGNDLLLTVDGKLYRSTNDGQNWTPVTQGLPTNSSCGALAKNPAGDLFLIGTRPQGSMYVHFIAKSTDNGNTWSPTDITNSFQGGLVRAFCCNAGRMFISMYTVLPVSPYHQLDLYESLNDGVSWSITGTSLKNIPMNEMPDLTISKTGEMYVLSFDQTTSRLFGSTDNGVTWNEIMMTGFGAADISINYCILQTKGPLLMAGLTHVSSGKYTVVSNDLTTGIAGNEKDQKLRIFPNPGSDLIRLDGVTDVVGVEILSVAGQVVRTFSDASGDLDLRGLSPGVYQLNVKTRTSHTSTRFVKSN